MKEFEIAAAVLKDIIENNSLFSDALKNNIRQYSANELKNKPFISALVGCELRHHLVFERNFNDHFASIDYAMKYLILIAIANNSFARRYDAKEVVSYLINMMKQKNYKLDEADFLAFFERIEDNSKLIPNDVEINSPLYFSYRFNTPLWLVKMWQKHYGRAKAYKIMRANSKMEVQTCYINKKFTSKVEVLKNSLFEPCEKFDDMVIYKGKIPTKKVDFFMNFDVFLQKLAITDMIQSLDLKAPLEVLQYSGIPNSIGESLFSMFSKNDLTMELAVPDIAVRSDLLRIRKITDMSNIHVFEAKPNLLLANLHTTFDVVFVNPANSSFELIRQYPDYLLHFDRNSFDNLILNEKEALLQSSQFVNDDGRLVYAINTISIKEGHYVIVDFLRNQPEFELVMEKQYFPYDEFDSALYYAVLKKTGKKID